MLKFRKDVPTEIEFGDYGHFATMTPIALPSEQVGRKEVVTFAYNDNTGRTIDLCIEPNEIDYKSFER